MTMNTFKTLTTAAALMLAAGAASAGDTLNAETNTPSWAKSPSAPVASVARCTSIFSPDCANATPADIREFTAQVDHGIAALGGYFPYSHINPSAMSQACWDETFAMEGVAVKLTIPFFARNVYFSDETLDALVSSHFSPRCAAEFKADANTRQSN
jgi:hypothetical protein